MNRKIHGPTSEGGGTTGACGGPYVYHETINSWDYITGENAAGIPPVNNMKEAIYYLMVLFMLK